MKLQSLSLLWIIIVCCITIVYSCYFPYIYQKPTGICEYLSRYLVRRPEWKAKEPNGTLECLWGPVDLIILHHTVTPPCTTPETCAESMRKLQEEHMTEKKWADVGYHFIIGGDGQVYEGRPWYKVGAHTKYHNRVSLGIALIGDFDKDCPDPVMLDLIPKIIYCGVEKGYVDPDFYVIGHRDAYCTTCPGDAFYKVIKKLPRFPKKVPIYSYTCDVTNETTVAPKPETTTTPATTTTDMPTTTTSKPTTTTPKPTTTTPAPTTTTQASTTTEKSKNYYIVLAKQKLPWFLPWEAEW